MNYSEWLNIGTDGKAECTTEQSIEKNEPTHTWRAQREYKRGDIVYVKNISSLCVGSEQTKSRPAVIVSNDIGNKYAPIVEVVYLSTKSRQMPTHAKVMCYYTSKALCESVTTVAKERIVSYIGRCTNEEMTEINRCLCISLGLTNGKDGIDKRKTECKKVRL